MNLIECIVLGFSGLRRNPLRATLTILGIVIGVGAVVGMVSVGDGARSLVLKEIERTGGLKIIEIFRGEWDRRSGTLTKRSGRVLRRWRSNRGEDLETEDIYELMAKARGVVHAVAEDDAQGKWNIYYQGVSKEAGLMSSTVGYDRSHNWYVQSGRFFTEEEVEAASQVVVIGYNLYKEIFKGENPVGKQIRATRTTSWGPRYDVRLRVIGVMEEKGGIMDTEGWDDLIMVPVTTFQQRMKGRAGLDRIRVEVESLEMVEPAIADAKRILRRLHRDTEYNYWTAQEELGVAKRVGGTMKALMGGIAGIALFVAGIGIMNIMLVSVTERTREIGLRKAIGAKRWDILMQFLVEAVVLSLTGGVLGAILGVFMGRGVALLIVKFVWAESNWPSVISVGTIVLALSVSVGVGVFFGLYPANKAAKLTPVEALRSD